jgi:tetratricopeptide (TPR) repeat protein
MTTSGEGEKREPITGVFSSQELKKVGTGTTQRKFIQKAFWFAVESEDGSIEVQPLNPNYVPSGPKKSVTLEYFLAHYSPEPELYVSNVFPKMRELNKIIARGDRYRKNREFYSAEVEYNNAIKVDEENVRANFGLGITYLERGESGKAENIFERLVKLEAAFEPEHKHLFNEFGIKLRKNGLFNEALRYYTRALELSAQDENLLYNLARVYMEKKDYGKAVEFLLQSLELNLGLEESVKFLLWVVSKGLVPEGRKPAVAEMLRNIKQAGVGVARAQSKPAETPPQNAEPQGESEGKD